MVARYADSEEIEVGGNSEEDCMERRSRRCMAR